jgi:hypothetical protein
VRARGVAVAVAAACALALLATAAAPAHAQEEPAPPPPSPQRVLVTGDSLMYVMQDPLARRLRHRGYEVTTDSRVGTGLTKPWLMDWAKLAREHVEKLRPDVTFMFIGGNDVHSIRGERCCGPRWVERYAERARELMAIYGRTVWLTLPAPVDPALGRVFRAINRALRLAAAGDRAQLVDIVPVFTPHWRYRRAMLWNGERVIVRQMDGVHLGHQGVKIAADLATAALT